MNPTERAMYDFWGKWFAQPLEEKMKHLRQPGRGGYYPPASEAPGFTGKPDPKEYFHWRYDQPGHPDPTTPQDHTESTTEQVFRECFWTAQEWLADRGLSEVVNSVKAADCVLRIIHYLPNPEPLVGEAHRDFDLLTVSVEGTVPGLEVLGSAHEFRPGDPAYGWERQCSALHPVREAGQWVDAHCGYPPEEHPRRGGWTPQETGIQVGEMLEIYTENEWSKNQLVGGSPIYRATTHRVRTEPNTDRLKAVFFYLPPNDFELRPGFTAGDYLKDVLSKAGTYGIGAK